MHWCYFSYRQQSLEQDLGPTAFLPQKTLLTTQFRARLPFVQAFTFFLCHASYLLFFFTNSKREAGCIPHKQIVNKFRADSWRISKEGLKALGQKIKYGFPTFHTSILRTKPLYKKALPHSSLLAVIKLKFLGFELQDFWVIYLFTWLGIIFQITSLFLVLVNCSGATLGFPKTDELEIQKAFSVIGSILCKGYINVWFCCL